jgi:hypothetical protein
MATTKRVVKVPKGWSVTKLEYDGPNADVLIVPKGDPTSKGPIAFTFHLERVEK